MEEVTRLPLAQAGTVHKVLIGGYGSISMKIDYDEEVIKVQILDEETSGLENVPLLFLFHFRNADLNRSNETTWIAQLGGQSVQSAEWITVKTDKEQVKGNTKACEKFLSNGEDFDICLSCGNYKVHANKKRLGAKSDYFNALFFDDFKEKNQKEIELDGVDGEVVHAVVLIADEARYRITDFNIEPIMNAADRFGMKSLMHKCADHLLMNSKLGEFKRLQYLDKYNDQSTIDELIDTIEKKMAIRENNEFDELSDELQLKILREAVKELKAKPL